MNINSKEVGIQCTVMDDYYTLDYLRKKTGESYSLSKSNDLTLTSVREVFDCFSFTLYDTLKYNSSHPSCLKLRLSLRDNNSLSIVEEYDHQKGIKVDHIADESKSLKNPLSCDIHKYSISLDENGSKFNNCNKKLQAKDSILENLFKLENLLFKVFSGDQFLIEDFELSIPELHLLVEILIRKNRNSCLSK